MLDKLSNFMLYYFVQMSGLFHGFSGNLLSFVRAFQQPKGGR